MHAVRHSAFNVNRIILEVRGKKKEKGERGERREKGKGKREKE